MYSGRRYILGDDTFRRDRRNQDLSFDRPWGKTLEKQPVGDARHDSTLDEDLRGEDLRGEDLCGEPPRT